MTPHRTADPAWTPAAACFLILAGLGFVAGVAHALTTPFAQGIHGLSRWVFYLPFSVSGIAGLMALTVTPAYLLTAFALRRAGRAGWFWRLAGGGVSGVLTAVAMLLISDADGADIMRALPSLATYYGVAGTVLGLGALVLDKVVAHVAPPGD